MTPEEILAAITEVVNTWVANANDEDGDKFLSDSHSAMERIDEIIGGDISGAVRDHFITRKAAS